MKEYTYLLCLFFSSLISNAQTLKQGSSSLVLDTKYQDLKCLGIDSKSNIHFINQDKKKESFELLSFNTTDLNPISQKVIEMKDHERKVENLFLINDQIVLCSSVSHDAVFNEDEFYEEYYETFDLQGNLKNKLTSIYRQETDYKIVSRDLIHDTIRNKLIHYVSHIWDQYTPEERHVVYVSILDHNLEVEKKMEINLLRNEFLKNYKKYLSFSIEDAVINDQNNVILLLRCNRIYRNKNLKDVYYFAVGYSSNNVIVTEINETHKLIHNLKFHVSKEKKIYLYGSYSDDEYDHTKGFFRVGFSDDLTIDESKDFPFDLNYFKKHDCARVSEKKSELKHVYPIENIIERDKDVLVTLQYESNNSPYQAAGVRMVSTPGGSMGTASGVSAGPQYFYSKSIILSRINSATQEVSFYFIKKNQLHDYDYKSRFNNLLSFADNLDENGSYQIVFYTMKSDLSETKCRKTDNFTLWSIGPKLKLVSLDKSGKLSHKYIPNITPPDAENPFFLNIRNRGKFFFLANNKDRKSTVKLSQLSID